MLRTWISGTKAKVRALKTYIVWSLIVMDFIYTPSWYKIMDPRNPDALLPLTEKTFKYKFEATIPEPDVCTDCILARITVINVIAADYGVYVLRATSEQAPGYFHDDHVKLYRKFSFRILFKRMRIGFYCFFPMSLFKETPECQQSITNPDNKGCRSPPTIIV
jgi:hypothetical protein